MFNTYSIHGNEIWIDAPGNSNTNRLWNDLIWALNGYLSARVDLYKFHVQRKLPEGALYKCISSVPARYAVFQELDDMFVRPTHLSDKEVEQYRKIMDPLGEMADDVFEDACRMENVDLEYIAASDTDQLLNTDLTCRSVKAFECKVRSAFPAYVSLFGAKEMRLTIHQDGLLKPIHSIVKRYCINKMV